MTRGIHAFYYLLRGLEFLSVNTITQLPLGCVKRKVVRLVQNCISTMLIPSFSAKNVIHYGD